MKSLRGKTAIVTGASAGLGARVAIELAREGMNIILAARTVDALESVAQEIRKLGSKAIAIPTDVTDDSQLERLVARTTAEFGKIDVLVNNAGVEAFRPFHELSTDDIRRTVDVNLMATLILTKLVIPQMNGKGHIVNMASTAGKHGPAYGAAYGATKAALIAFTQSLRAEYKSVGLSASAICPGFAVNGGIYDEILKRIGSAPPWYVGTTTADAVAKAVVSAIKHDRPEVIVNSMPLRPIFALCQMMPRLGEWLVRKTTIKFLKRAGLSNRESKPADIAQPDSRAA